MPAHNLDDIDERDLSEAPRLAKDPESRGVMLALAAAALLFIAFLIYSSFPELSPEEIISMEGYEGEQTTKTIFNIHSFDNDDKKSEDPGIAQADDNLPPIAVTEPVETLTAAPEEEVVFTDAPEAIPEVSPVAVEVTESVAVIEPSTVEPVTETELPIAVTEPVVKPVTVSQAPRAEDASSRVITFSPASDEKVVAAMATTPTIEEASDTVVVASVAAIEPVPIPVGDSIQQPKGFDINQTTDFLPLRYVLEDGTELKASQSVQSKTLLTLRRGVFVTAFESEGEWVHIGTNDGSSITGYVFESELGQSNR